MDNKQRVLIVDDDNEIRELVAKFLKQHEFECSLAQDAKMMDKLLEDEPAFDVLILDLMMPGEDGLSVCRRLRVSEHKNLPIIMLTAMGEETDRIIGLEMGADDYLPKPFNPRELLARIKAVLRRSHGSLDDAAPSGDPEDLTATYHFNDWVFDSARRILIDGNKVQYPLSTGEFQVLSVFVERPQRVLSRDQLLDMARGREAILFDRSMDVQISRLRKKLGDDPKSPTYIQTIRGGGYKFAVDVRKQG
ncbi:MAG: response regulator [Alphaproteobacteria bacterium]